MRRILVTGAAGFIGRHTCRELASAGHQVTAVDVDGPRVMNMEGAGITSDIADVTEDGDVDDFVRVHLPDAILHLAANASVPRSMSEASADAHLNIVGTVNVLEAAAKYGVRNVVCASSGGAVYGAADHPLTEDEPQRPACPYGAGKAAAEQYMRYFAEHRGLCVTALRYSNVYGPGQNPDNGVVAAWRRLIVEGRNVTIYGDGTAVRDFVHVSDVVAANIKALTGSDGFMPFNIGTGVGTSLNELARLMGAPGITYEPPRAGDLQWNVLNCARARRLLGWTARVSLKDGLESLR